MMKRGISLEVVVFYVINWSNSYNLINLELNVLRANGANWAVILLCSALTNANCYRTVYRVEFSRFSAWIWPLIPYTKNRSCKFFLTLSLSRPFSGSGESFCCVNVPLECMLRVGKIGFIWMAWLSHLIASGLGQRHRQQIKQTLKQIDESIVTVWLNYAEHSAAEQSKPVRLSLIYRQKDTPINNGAAVAAAVVVCGSHFCSMFIDFNIKTLWENFITFCLKWSLAIYKRRTTHMQGSHSKIETIADTRA